MWMRHSCFTNLVSLCVDLRAIVVRLCSLFKVKKEYPLVLETRTKVPIQASRCPAIVSTTRAGRAVWVDRVSPFKEYRTSKPSSPTSPPCPPGIIWASSSSTRKPRRISSHFLRAVDFASDMAEPSQPQMTESTPSEVGASASITASLVPSLAPTSASAVGTPTPPSATRSSSGSKPTSRQPSSTMQSSEPPSSTRVGVSTAPSSEVASHAVGSRTSIQRSSTASLSSSSGSASFSSSSRPLSSGSASESPTSAPPSSNSQSASVSSSRTTSISHSSLMSTSTSPSSSSSSSPVFSSRSDSSASPSATLTLNGNNATLSSSTVESSASRTSSGLIFQSPTSSSSSPVTPLPSSDTRSSSSETPSPTHNPAASVASITAISTTTLTTQIPASSSTGILRPGDYARSGFANDTGAIVGVSVAATAGLLALAFLIFFACRKYRSRVSHNESTDRILALARNVSWRTPVDGSLAGSLHEKVFYAKSGSASPPREANYDYSSDGHRDEFGSISRSHGTIERPDYPAMHRPMNPTFSGQPYVPAHSDPRRPDPAAFPTQMYPFANIQGSSMEWRPADPFEHEDDPVSSTRSYGPTRSETALVFPGWSSPFEHGVIPHSTAHGSWGATDSTPRTRNSVSGPRAMPGSMQKSRRHSSTPPSAFMGSHDDATTDHEGQSTLHDSQADKMSVKSIISIFKSARRTSSQSLASTIKSLPFSRLTDQEEPIPTLPLRRDQMLGSSNIYSPSLLNPPIALPPQPPLSFPRGVTGHGYDPHQSATLWPPPTLPPTPDSPAPTDNSSMIEGLLHPRLALEGSRQASQTSFRDNEDYSRPISGLVKNHHLRSTTTIDTPDTAESEDGASTLERGIAY